jgi:hypothetical protein
MTSAAENDALDAQVIDLDRRREQITKWLADCICGEGGRPLEAP